MVDVAHRDAGVLHDVVERRLGALEQVARDLLELAATERLVEEDGAAVLHRDVGQVDRRRRRAGQLDLRALGGLADTGHGHLVLGQVDARLGLEGADDPVDDRVVPVVTTEVVVTAGGLDLDDAVADLEQGHVERAAAEVEDEDRLVVALVEAVRERGRGGLVDDAADVQARDLAGLLGRLTLVIVEVRRHGDDGVGDRLAQVRLGVALQLLQDEGADLLRVERLPVDLRLPVGAHVALDGADGAVDVRDALALGDLASQDLAVLREGDDGRGGASALGVRDDGGLATLQDGDDGVRRAEVDSDGTCHGGSSC